MLKHPLQLKRSQLLEFHLDPAQEFDSADSGFLITTTPGLENTTDLRSWLVFFRLTVGPSEEGKKSPYNLVISMVAEYQWHGLTPSWKEVAQIVGVNGCSMLYGQTRELILLLSGRAIHGQFQLPSVSFQDFDPGEPPEGMPAAETSGPAKRAPLVPPPPAASLPTKLPPKRPRKTKNTR